MERAVSAPRTFYVSTQGNNQNDGLSAAKPFKTIAALNLIDFEPGDKIMLEGNATFEGHLQLTAEDAGTLAKPVEISSYGTGKATIMNPETNAVTIWDVGGIVIKNRMLDGGTTYCTIQYCYARDNDGAGILVWNYAQAPHRLGNNTLRYNILENNARRNDYGEILIGTGGTPS